MKTDIHPEYNLVTVTCSCGNTFETRSTADNLKVELCSQCHPFYTGKQKLVDTGGRIDRFERRFGKRRRPGQAEATEDEATEDTAPEDTATEDRAPEDTATEDRAPAEAAAPEAEAPTEVAAPEAEASTETDAPEAESQTES